VGPRYQKSNKHLDISKTIDSIAKEYNIISVDIRSKTNSAKETNSMVQMIFNPLVSLKSMKKRYDADFRNIFLLLGVVRLW